MKRKKSIVCVENYHTWTALKEKILYLEKLMNEHSVVVFIFHKNILKQELWCVHFINFWDISEVIEQLTQIMQEYDILSLQTQNDFFIPQIETIKSKFWIVSSLYPEVTYNKYLQRKVLERFYPDLSVKYFRKYKNKNIELDKSYIYKDIIWLDSLWVQIVNPWDELKIYWKDGIIEEVIEGEKYSIDYFVDKYWKITYISPVVLWKSWYDIWVEDFFVFLWCIHLHISNIHQSQDCVSFITSCVRAFGIRNTFMHHEFFIDSHWKYKHIEINPRQWFNRIQMVHETTKYNLLEAYLWIYPEKESHIPSSNYAVIKVYPLRRWILKCFSQSTLSYIEWLESFLSLEMDNSMIWEEIGLSQDWFSNIWHIKLSTQNVTIIHNDINTIQSIYEDIIILI